jgi:ribA/ribD-fused uncharacterized protein
MQRVLPVDVDGLKKAMRGGESFGFLLFWGHTPRADGRLSDACFSQWWASQFEIEGVTYKTAEHWMMASKARLFEDAEALEQILAADTPAKAKKLGRGVRGFDESRWKKERFEIVTRGSVAKFSSTPELRKYLLGTGNAILVEASPYDRVWGIGLSRDHSDARDPFKWQGSNLLGFALIRARAILLGG